MTDTAETLQGGYHHRCGHALMMEMDADDGKPNWFDAEQFENANHRVATCPRDGCRMVLSRSIFTLGRAIKRGDIVKDREKIVKHEHTGDTAKALVDHTIVLIDLDRPQIVVDCGWSYNPIGSAWDSKGVWEDPQKTARGLRVWLANDSANLGRLTAQVNALQRALDSIQEVASG